MGGASSTRNPTASICLGMTATRAARTVPFRSIVRDAAAHGSAGVLLAHNHPSGDCRPSRADCLATRRLAAAVEALECAVVDHLVFGGGECASFRRLGLL